MALRLPTISPERDTRSEGWTISPRVIRKRWLPMSILRAAMLSALEPIVTVYLGVVIWGQLPIVTLVRGRLILITVILLTRNELTEIKPAD